MATPPGPPAPDAADALEILARVLAASSLPAAAHGLVAGLCSAVHVDRASIGLHQGGRTQLLACSHADLGDHASEWTQQLVGAMDEAIEQGVSLAWPGAPGQHTPWIVLEHAVLQRAVGGSVATVPLGGAGLPFAAVCVERREGAASIGADELRRLEQILVLVGPALHWMHLASQPVHQRLWRQWMTAWRALQQPGRKGTRRILMGGSLALLVLAAVPLDHTVGGRARIEGGTQRVVSAPTDGFVKIAHVRPGDRVRAGAPLVDLVEGDLALERERWRSQIAQHENAYASAMAKSDRVGASTSMARMGEAQAQLALIEDQLARGRVTAPFDALVVQGDLSQSVGAPVRQGDTLLTLATTDRFRVIIEVDEIDIAQVRAGLSGQLSVSSLPWEQHALVVERITPLARAVEGRNIFEVEARLSGPADGLRPGLLGRAELVVGRLPPLWAWGRHGLERLRLGFWSWFG